MENTIYQAKANFLQAKQRLLHALATTPDDRINWSPSPTARTPLHQVAHAAAAVKNIHLTLDGHPFPVPTVEEADKGFREWEKQFTTREQVTEILEQNCDAYVEWLDALDPARLDSMVQMPFNLGYAPVGIGLTFQPLHMNEHSGQIFYIQTIYGDRDWHMS